MIFKGPFQPKPFYDIHLCWNFRPIGKSFYTELEYNQTYIDLILKKFLGVNESRIKEQGN